MELNSYAAAIVFTLLWVLFWAIATFVNRNDPIFAKRGLLNVMIFSFVIYLSFCENLMLLSAFYDIYVLTPCVYHLYTRYIFFGLVLFTYSVRGICLLYEKNYGMIKISHAEEFRIYTEKMNWFERLILRVGSLERKLKNGNLERDSVIEDHLNQNRFFKPQFIFKCSVIFMLSGAVIATAILFLNRDTVFEPDCKITFYFPLYLFFVVIITFSFFVSYLLRKSTDPYFLKNEFTLLICVVLPICMILGVILRLSGYRNWTISVLLLAIVGHLLSVVLPNVLAWKHEKIKSEKLRRGSIISVSLDIDGLKRKAAERFCLELVLFKEDYDKMKLLQQRDQIETACEDIFKKYIKKNADMEINISYTLSKKVQVAFNEKNYAILDQVMKEVKLVLYGNLGLYD
eukprot:NODE_262_length_12566_cov_0.133392.p3 type:complete len:401 gc:universal NODE_262_length_12566_cov_0.133392:5739-4537(-)